ncbi:MAG: hypothetical protein ACRDR6_03425 [Pseudonocardiaceae bacterium]
MPDPLFATKTPAGRRMSYPPTLLLAASRIPTVGMVLGAQATAAVGALPRGRPPAPAATRRSSRAPPGITLRRCAATGAR